MAQYTKIIRAGRLDITTDREMLPLTDVLDFASRLNPKRGYLFVSKVLGKHIPTRPSRMRAMHALLASQLPKDERTLFIGLAETAVGMGSGVADAYARLNQLAPIFIQTTRYASDDPVLFEFEEPHSHAVDHILYAPSEELEREFFQSETVMMVDDEVSTGTTLLNLSQEISHRLPNMRRVVFSTFVNWLSVERRQELIKAFNANGVELQFASLVDGRFAFERGADWSVGSLPFCKSPKPAKVPPRMDLGRCGLRMPYQLDAEAFELSEPLPMERPIRVIGTGEFMFIPQLLAYQLELAGYDVWVQSTTRSPAMVADAIADVQTLTDEFGQGIPNYLYNTGADENLVPVVCYESPALAIGHALFAGRRISATMTERPVEAPRNVVNS